MDTLSKPGTTADIAHGSGTLLDVLSYLKDPTSKAYKAAGKSTKKATALETQQYIAKGKEAFSSSQRAAVDETKQADLAISTAVAKAAGSGGGANDPTIQNIIGNLASEGKTNSLAALYQGESSQVDYENFAKVNQYNADSDAAGYKLRAKGNEYANYDAAGGTLLKGIATFAEKYG